MLALLNFSILLQMLVLTIYLAFNISYVNKLIHSTKFPFSMGLRFLCIYLFCKCGNKQKKRHNDPIHFCLQQAVGVGVSFFRNL